jgi:hypothetical protein
LTPTDRSVNQSGFCQGQETGAEDGSPACAANASNTSVEAAVAEERNDAFVVIFLQGFTDWFVF